MVAPLTVVVPPRPEPMTTLVVDPVVEVLPILIVWVLPLPAAAPMLIVLLAVELPMVMPPVLFEVPRV